MATAPPQGTIESLKSHYGELIARVRTLRKSGLDPTYPEMMLTNIPSKIKMAEVTQDPADVSRAYQLMSLAEPELKELEQKSEREEGILQHIHGLIAESYDLISNDKIESARKNYEELMDYYTDLPIEMKMRIYSSCAKLHDKLADL